MNKDNISFPTTEIHTDSTESYLGCSLLEELTTPVPQHKPEEWHLYNQTFVNFWPKSTFFVRRSYQGTFFQVKRKGTDAPLPLFPDLAESLIAKHLDPQRANDVYHVQLPDYKPNQQLPEFRGMYWIGLTAPKKTKIWCHDIDHTAGAEGKKANLLGYSVGSRNQPSPVMRCPLGFFIKAKRLYDAYPDAIWCISSKSLGLHVWHHEDKLRDTQWIVDRELSRLDLLSLRNQGVEVHPNFERCLRRPFGEDYCTITPSGLLQAWQLQIRNLLNPTPSPTFETIFKTLLRIGLLQRKDLMYRPVGKALAPLHNDWAAIKSWWESGFVEPCTKISIPAAPFITLTDPGRPSTCTQPRKEFEWDNIRNGRWAFGLEKYAVEGLPHTDSLGTLATEFATWLWFIELYNVPPQEREEQILDLLWSWVARCHNGTISRMGSTTGEKNIREQLKRCLRTARRSDANSKELFARLRQKRDQGRYSRIVNLVSILAEGRQIDKELHISSGLLISVSSLPPELTRRIDEVRGRCKVGDFAAKLVNHLYARKGTARVSQQALFELLGYENPTQLQKYKRILEDAGVIMQGKGYRKGEYGRSYSLTKLAKQLMNDVRTASTQTA